MGAVRRVLAEAWGVFLVLNAGVDALVAVAALGGARNPRLDVLSHFSVLYLASALAAVLLIAPLRNWARPTVFALSAVAIVASGTLVAPEFTRSRGPLAAAEAPNQLKIIQYNALRYNADVDREVDWLIAQRPDFVTIQEARHDLRDVLVKRTGWQVAGAAGTLMIFSREPRITMNRPTLGPRERLHFVNATYPSASGPFELVTVHLHWPTSPIHATEQAQLPALTALLPRERMILTGDFNSAPWSAALKRTDRTIGLTRRDRALASFPADLRGWRWPMPVLPIDHVYAGPGWATVSVTRGPRLGSDHYPVVLVLAPVRRPPPPSPR
jgi:endonuclease/exonuclease/phosphatase (EEP) superfamily protein YafD